MNKAILRLAIPSIVSNVTIPLLGMIDIAIAGRIGDDSTIAALAIGTAIFNFIYWNFAFLRMGTSGLAAQAYGAGDKRETANILGRSMIAALAIALLLLVFNRPIGALAMKIMEGGSDEVMALAADYFYARIWAAPAAIGIFSLHGWLTGMQDTTSPMVVSILNNIINVACSLWFVFGLNMGVVGIAWGTVVAQYTSLVVTLVIIALRYGSYVKQLSLRESLRMEPLVRFFRINSDAFLRTLCVCTVYTCFTAFSARFGDTILATNELLMQLFMLFSYMLDGFCYAAESLTGRFIGERNRNSLARCIKLLVVWCGVVAAIYIVAYIFWWKPILGIFTSSPTIMACAEEYIVWIVMVPLVGFIPFLIDGILIGATKTRTMRNTTFFALVAFFGLFYSLVGVLDNRALWIAFIGFIVVRFALMLVVTKGLNTNLLMDTSKE